jgi:hypothetical protein
MHRACIVAILYLLIPAVASSGPVPRFERTNPPPGTIFCEDFESANWRTHWTDPILSDITDVPDNGPSAEPGNNAVELRAPVGLRGGRSLWTDVTPRRRLYTRWYFKWQSGFTFSDPNHGGGLVAGDNNKVGISGYRPAGDSTGWASFWSEYQPGTAKPYAYCYYHGMYQDGSTPGNIYGDSFPCVFDQDGTPYYCTKDWHRPIGGMASISAVRQCWKPFFGNGPSESL